MERSTCTAVVHDMQVFGPQTVTRTHCDNRNVFPVKQRYQHVLKKKPMSLLEPAVKIARLYRLVNACWEL
jgi:hypothetical protein